MARMEAEEANTTAITEVADPFLTRQFRSSVEIVAVPNIRSSALALLRKPRYRKPIRLKAPFVYRLGRQPLTLQRRVRLPQGAPICQNPVRRFAKGLAGQE